LKHAAQAGTGKFRFLLHQGDVYLFVLEHKRNEDGFAPSVLVRRQARQTVAAIHQLFNGQVQEMIVTVPGLAIDD
jgi:hypothetical protein